MDNFDQLTKKNKVFSIEITSINEVKEQMKGFSWIEVDVEVLEVTYEVVLEVFEDILASYSRVEDS